MRKSAKRAIVIVSTLALTGVASAAWASWLAGGEGKVYAQAETAQELVISEATTSATLYPGATGDAFIKIENPNKYPVRVTTIKWTPSDGAVGTGGKGTCNNTGVYFGDFSGGPVGTNGLLGGLTLDLDAKETKTFTLKDAVRMINNSEDGCQGATISLPVKVTGASNAS